MRTYETTHPWISFQLDLRQAPHTLWLLLGEAQSKIQHVAGVPLLPAVQESFHRLFLAKGVLATTAIEGNTLTEEEVLKHLGGELEVPKSKDYLKQEIDNIIVACNQIGKRILGGENAELSIRDVKGYNRQVLSRLPLADEIEPGELRGHEVGVGRYKGAPPADIEYLMTRLCRWLNEEFKAPDGYGVAFGILRAILAHLYIAWIHPFADGNGRTARLIEFQLLLSVGVPSIAAHLLSNHYNQTRAEYYRQLDQAHRLGGQPIPFIEYALQGFADGLKEQIETIKQQQLAVHWVNYIHDLFRNQDTRAGIRRRRLAIDLSVAGRVVPVSEIRYLTPRLAAAYASKTEKTVKRDLNHLEQLGLLRRSRRGVRAQTELILAFLPAVREEEAEQ